MCNTLSSPCLGRILLVEDDASIQLVYNFFLKKLNFKVRSVSTAKAALEAIKTDTYDTVILDLGLPDAPGEAVLSAIREHEKNINSPQPIPIFIITAHGDETIIQTCCKKGADDVLIKPVSFEQFRQLLNIHLPSYS